MKIINLFVVILLFALPGVAAEPGDADRNWPHWRGPMNTGVSPAGDPPIEWSETKNIRWKVPIPGEGQGSPIVWNDRVFVTSAIDTGNNVLQHEIFALSRSNGEILWRTTANSEKPHEGRHPTGTYASNSAVTDGERLYAYFGSRGL